LIGILGIVSALFFSPNSNFSKTVSVCIIRWQDKAWNPSHLGLVAGLVLNPGERKPVSDRLWFEKG
jgi:hypothetical protein